MKENRNNEAGKPGAKNPQGVAQRGGGSGTQKSENERKTQSRTMRFR
jgi:hypothetical protein